MNAEDFLEALADPLRRPIRTPVAIVVAHPDDEVVGIGSHLGRLENVHLIHVTDGSPRSLEDARRTGYSTAREYAAARRLELLHALELARVPLSRTVELRVVDQQAALQLVRITRMLCRWFERLRPAMVLTHPYEGGHPDHDAVAFAVQSAGALVARPPAVVEMAFYHWRGKKEEAGDFLPGPSTVWSIPLEPLEVQRKQRLLACFATQTEVLKMFPADVERFRLAPPYDFKAPPHPGLLCYEAWKLGVTGERFRVLACQALRELGL